MFTPDRISPEQRLGAAHRQNVRQIERVWFPLYGLAPGWSGSRATGVTTFQTGVTRDKEGVHGEMHATIQLIHWQGTSELMVESTDQALSIDDAALIELAGGGAVAEPLTIRLDGHEIAFASARSNDRLVARWSGYEVTVTVVADRWPMAFGLELVRVTDPEPYHEGRLRMLEERSGFNLRSD